MRLIGTIREITGTKSFPLLLPALVSTVSGFLWLTFGSVAILAGLSAIILLLVALVSYPWTLALVLVGRTCLDLFWEENIYLEGVRVSAASVFTLVILVLLLLTMLVRRESITKSDGTRALGLLLVGSAVGTVTAYARFGGDANMAFREMVRLAVLLCWYVFLYERTRRTGASRPFLRAVLLASVLPLLLGVWDVLSGTGISTGGVTRVSSTFVDPNAFGFYLVFLIMFSFAWIAGGGQLPAWLMLATSLLLLIFTYSRGAWISMMIAVPIFLLRVSRRRRLLIGLSLVIVIVTAYPLLSERLASVDYADIVRESHTEVTSNSYTFRILIWKRLLELWTEHPVFGWGLETTALINPILSEWDGKGAAAHNDGIRYLVETGLVGMIFYAAFLLVLGRRAYRCVARLRGHPLHYQAIATIVIYVAFVIQSFTVAEPLHQTIFAFHFLGLMAVVEGCSDYVNDTAQSADGIPLVQQNAGVRIGLVNA